MNWQLHSIGLAALRRPRSTLLLLALSTLVSLFGASRLTIDPSLTRLFHGQTAEYANFERLLAVLPEAEQNVLVLVHAPRLFEPERLKALKAFHLELRLIEPVRRVSSIFNARRSWSGEQLPSPIFPEKIPAVSQLPDLEDRLKQSPLVRHRLLANSPEGQWAVFSASLDADRELSRARDASLGEIQTLAKQLLEPAGISWRIGGIPQARIEMLSGIQRDFLFLNSVGFALGVLICTLLLRNARLVLLAGLCPLIGAIGGAGVMGLMGVKLSPLMTSIPLLVMAVTFTDSMHLLHAIRNQLNAGEPVDAAVRSAVTRVGPACVLASVTTVLALFSLMLTASPLVAAFGLWGGLANLLSMIVMLALLPAAAVLLLGNRSALSASARSPVPSSERHTRLEYLCERLGHITLRHHRLIALSGLLLTIALTLTYAQLAPKYRLSDQLNEASAFRNVNERLDTSFQGANQIAVLIEPTTTAPLPLARLVEATRRVHVALTGEEALASPLSLFSLFDVASLVKPTSADRISQRLGLLPAGAAGGLLDRTKHTATVLINVRDLEAAELATLADAIERKLVPVRSGLHDVRLTVTGMPVLLARETPKIVHQINAALLAALVIVFLVIALSFRSLKMALISIVPNVLPIVASGALVYLVVGGLDYASVIGLTIAFGLAVDDSIHFLSRFRMLATEQEDTTTAAILETLRSTGPVLISTTVILFCTLAITIFGNLPPTRIFGQTCAAMLVAALLADLLILPAIVRTVWIRG